MKVNNKNTLFKLKAIQLLIRILFLATLVLIVFDIISCNLYYAIPSIVILYILFMLFWKTREFSFVEFSDDGDFLLVKFFKDGGIFGKSEPKMIKTPKTQFNKYEIFNNKNRKKLILYQNTKTGIHTYPYISISAYSKKQITDLEKSLNQYVQQK